MNVYMFIVFCFITYLLLNVAEQYIIHSFLLLNWIIYTNKFYSSEPYTETSDSDVISDGNSNVNHTNNETNETNAIVKEIITLSWFVFMELKARANLSKENGNTHNLPSSQEDEYKKRISELENMVSIFLILFIFNNLILLTFLI